MKFNRRQYWALVKALVLMDLRGQYYSRATGVKPSDPFPPLFWILGQYLFISAVLAIVLFGRVDVFAYVLVQLSVTIILVFSALVVEFNEVVLNVEDTYILGHRPISKATYAAARLTNLGVYIGLIFLSMSIFPAIIGCALRDTGWWYLPAFLIASFATCMITACFVIFFFSTARSSSKAFDYREILSWTQIVVVFVVFYGAQYMLRDSSRKIELFLAYLPDWVDWLPHAWLARFVEQAAVAPGWETLLTGLLILTGTILAIVLVVLHLRYYYQGLRQEVKEFKEVRESTVKNRRNSWLTWLASSSQERAALRLCGNILRRDYDLRMRSVPILAALLALIVIGAGTKQLGNPFAAEISESTVSMAFVQVFALSVPVILHNFRFSRYYQATWVLQVSPSPGYFTYLHAARKAVCYAIHLPILVLLFLFLSFLWKAPIDALIYCVFMWLEVLLLSWVSVWGLKYRWPFSRPIERGSITGEIGPFLAAATVLVVALGLFQFWAMPRWETQLLFGGSLLILFFIGKKLIQRYEAQQLPSKA